MESNIINEFATPGFLPIADDFKKELEFHIDGVKYKFLIQYNFNVIELKIKKPKDIKCFSNQFSLNEIVRQLSLNPQRFDSCEKVCKYLIESFSQNKLVFKANERRCEIVFRTVNAPKIELKETFLSEKEMIEVLFVQNIELMAQVKDIKKECLSKVEEMEKESNKKIEEIKKQNTRVIDELKIIN